VPSKHSSAIAREIPAKALSGWLMLGVQLLVILGAFTLFVCGMARHALALAGSTPILGITLTVLPLAISFL
jgi:hypothetical protein